MYCKNCGTQIVDNASFCPQCGAAQEGAPTATAVINEKPVKKKKSAKKAEKSEKNKRQHPKTP